jgi:hypothetical protein
VYNVAGCDDPSQSGCTKPSGLRLINTRTWFLRSMPAPRGSGRPVVVERDGLRVYTMDRFLRIHAFTGREVAARVSATHASAHLVGAVGSRTPAIDPRTDRTRMLPARVPSRL